MISPPDLHHAAIDECRVTTSPEYPIEGYMNTATAGLLSVQAQCLSLERQTVLTSPDGVIPLSSEMLAYLTYEADRQGTDVGTIYQEEIAAERRIRAKALSREELRIIERDGKPDPRHLVADDDSF
jgi:hypothetical protein